MGSGQRTGLESIARAGARCAGLCLAASVVLSGWASSVHAQQSGPTTRQIALTETQIKRQNLARMLRPIEITFENEPLGNVMQFLAEYTGADLEPLWMTTRQPIGLDPDTEITLRVRGISALRLLELVLEQADGDLGYSGGSTWQMTSWGSIEAGPRERLMRKRRLEIYDVNDILFEVPDFPNVPTIDLQQALQGGQGGGGQSPFQDTQQETERIPKEERAEGLIDLITAMVEPETWDIGADIRYFQGTLIVSGPDYLHRALDGYRWWPSGATMIGALNGRRYVSFNLETGLSDVVEIVKQPVTGTTGGGGGPGVRPPGGGG